MNIDLITKSTLVSYAHGSHRPLAGLPAETEAALEQYAAGLQILVKLRRRRSNRAAALRNRQEEGAAAASFESRHGPGSAYEQGMYANVPGKPDIRAYLERALAAGLPDELAALCRKWLATYGHCETA